MTAPVFKGTSYLGLSNSQQEMVWKTEVGKLSTEVLSGGYYYLFRIDKKIEPKDYDYNEVNEQVLADYKQEKGQALYLNLINESLKTENVKLFLDRVQ